jgi:Uma2 family endonuclease
MSQAIGNPPSNPATLPPVSRIKNYITVGEEVRIPGWVVDFGSFRQWALSSEFPQRGRIDYLDDEIWADMTMEELLTHNQVKHEIGFVLTGIVRSQNLGMVIADRMRLVNALAKLSCEPDLAFVTWESLKSGRVLATPTDGGRVSELQGSPDMVLEVISDSSAKKDQIQLKQKYWDSEISEYWLVDVRKPAIQFEAFQHHSSGYRVDVTTDGWCRSRVLQNEFRLMRGSDPLGQQRYALEVR